jgi:hypothetical protein
MILKYTETLQKALDLKTKVEPWLHLAVVNVNPGDKVEYVFAVFIWDTRQILETGFIQAHINRGVQAAVKAGQRAIDNNELLIGKKADEINRALGWTDKKRANERKISANDRARQLKENNVTAAKLISDGMLTKLLDDLKSKLSSVKISGKIPSDKDFEKAEKLVNASKLKDLVSVGFSKSGNSANYQPHIELLFNMNEANKLTKIKRK